MAGWQSVKTAHENRLDDTASASKCAIMILVIDNYDSFTFNLVRYLLELGVEVEALRVAGDVGYGQ